MFTLILVVINVIVTALGLADSQVPKPEKKDDRDKIDPYIPCC